MNKETIGAEDREGEGVNIKNERCGTNTEEAMRKQSGEGKKRTIGRRREDGERRVGKEGQKGKEM